MNPSKTIVKSIALVSVFSFQYLQAQSQSSFQPKITKIAVGKNEADQSSIQANEYLFKDRIETVKLDSQLNQLTIKLRGTSKNGKWLDNKGQFISMDLNDQKVKWDRSINYMGQPLVQQGNVLIEVRPEASYVIDYETGKKGALIRCRPFIINPEKKFVIGYTPKTGGLSDDLACVNISDGSLKWQKKIKNGHDFSAFYSNDSTLLIITSGLHSVNINTGTGWDYNAVTSTKDYTNAVVAGAAGVALGVLTGFYTIPNKGADVTHAYASNVLEDSSSFYFASKDKLAKIDKRNGNIIWSYNLDESQTSKSNLFLNDGTLFMINYGYVFLNDRFMGVGRPFIAAFDAKTGDKKYLNPIQDIQNPIISYRTKNEHLLLLSKDNILKYNLNSGQFLAQNPLDETVKDEYLYFTGGEIYKSLQQGTSLHFEKLDTTKMYILTNTKKVLALEDDMSLSIFSNADSLYVNRFSKNGFKFINRKNETYILDADNKVKATLGLSGNVGLMGNRLYSMEGDRLMEVDLGEVMK